MPQDMFCAVVVRPSSVRSRRPSVVLLSLAAHGVAVLVPVLVTVAAPDALPFPRVALAYQQVRLADIDLPVPPPMKKAVTRPTSNVGTIVTASQPAPMGSTPPLEAPNGVARETGNERLVDPFGTGPTLGDRVGVVVGRPVDIEPPPPVPRVTAPVRLHSGITAPRKVVDVAPAYPPIARTVHIEGVVVLEATIDAEGRVTNLSVLRSVPLLDDAALQAVRQWRFTPAQLNGQAVAVIMTVTVRFALNN